MHFEIEKSPKGFPYLKKSYRRWNPDTDLRGIWVEIGTNRSKYIEYVIKVNQDAGYLVLIDEFGMYRALVLFD